jgi:hypothetical protein
LNSLDPNQSPSTPPISSNNSENQADPSSLHSVDESQQIRFTVAIGISASPAHMEFLNRSELIQGR